MFDINAPIERQFTRDGRKVTFVVDSGSNIRYPLAAQIEGQNELHSFTREGSIYNEEENDFDLVTHHEVADVVVWFVDVHTNGVRPSLRTRQGMPTEHSNQHILATIEFRFNPCTLKTSSKVVWTPEGGAK